LIEPNSFEEDNKDEFYKKAMNEELDQIENNDTWEFVQKTKVQECDWHKVGIQK
jgi:hypothetical protein